jgi:hypothetical protein
MAPVTVSEMIDYMGRAFSAGEITAASVLLDDVSAEAEAVINRSIGVQTVTESVQVIVPPFRGEPLWVALSRAPVASVTSVSLNGSALTASGSWAQERSGITIFAYAAPSPGVVTVEVTYTGGLTGSKADQAKGVIKRRVARVLNKRADEALGTAVAEVDGYRSQYESESFTEEELATLRRCRGVAVSSPRTDTPGLMDLSWGRW